MKAIAMIILVSVALSASGQKSALVTRVKDGDTFVAVWKGRSYYCRFSTIDAPEMKQSFGRASKDSLTKVILGKTVSLDSLKRDVYKRVLVNVQIGKTRLDSLVVRKGWAWQYLSYSNDPVLQMAMQEAIFDGLGLWGCGVTKVCPPWLYRHYDYRNQMRYCKGC